MTTLVRQIKFAFLLFGIVVLVGTIGYRIAGLGWLDAVYQTVITITTVGYTDLADDPAIKPFTIALVAVGTATLAVFISLITGAVIEAQLREYFGRRKVESKVRKLTNHIVLCGFGRLGQTIASELKRKKTPFVVLEKDADKAQHALENDYLVLALDATEEEALTEASIERAVGLLTTLGSDAENVYVTLTAKQMKRDLKVVSIAQDDRSRSKLKAAGADEVILPFLVGATRMAQAITAPAVSDFLEIATGANPIDFYMDEQRLAQRSSLCGQRLKETPIRRELGVIVVAVRHQDGSLEANPSPDLQLVAGDVLVSIGQRAGLEDLERMAAGASPA